MPSSSISELVPQLKLMITHFIEERKAQALDKLAEDSPKWAVIMQKFQRDTWLADAARRVSQIQVASHIIKAQNQFAQGTSLYYSIDTARCEKGIVRSDDLGELRYQDVVGNAAALDVYKFLSLSFEGETLLSRALRHDKALLAALHDDVSIATEWLMAFASITEGKDSTPRAHTFIKQLYWPLSDSQYHVLVPLFPSSLVHHVFLDLNEKRFSERAAEARKARKENTAYSGIHYDFPNIAVLKTGGSNPQNIGQLNSQRVGRSYLLPSLPPTWKTMDLPYGVTSIFTRHFPRNRNVYVELKSLITFLESNPPPIIKTRDKRDQQIENIIDELVNYAFRLRNEAPGWTQNAQCELSENEIYWLDPYRDEVDPNWTRPPSDEWLAEIKAEFSRFINRSLTTDKLKMADPEYHYWHDYLKHYIQQIDRFDMEVFS